jgi:hypothetical protein
MCCRAYGKYSHRRYSAAHRLVALDCQPLEPLRRGVESRLQRLVIVLPEAR